MLTIGLGDTKYKISKLWSVNQLKKQNFNVNLKQIYYPNIKPGNKDIAVARLSPYNIILSLLNFYCRNKISTQSNKQQ